MNLPGKLPRSSLGSLVLIATIMGGGAAAFAYTAGWLSPGRLTPERMIEALTPPGGPPLGYRRNHAKGICFTGTFEANGNGVELSRARVFARGQYAALGRFNLGTPNPNAVDATVRVRGLGLQITANGEVWRMAMINPPFFAVSTPQAFHDLLIASGKKDPDAMKAFIQANPEFGHFAAWAKTAPWTGSYAEEPYHGLNSFIFTDAKGGDHAVRWSLLPAARPVPISQADLEKRGPDYLEPEIAERVRTTGPLRWTMVTTVADPGDPTADPSKAWPETRRKVEVGTLIVQRIEPERDGPCRDINFDPTVLPEGIRVSDDPFPAARSSVYRKSYDLRAAEAKNYPRTGAAKP
ncbi:catalase family peroxidase [Bradyrhizobium daqingense]|uniref:Catalase-related peroxidase n=1 Tax=Bradyrhizobium daqingense TaxID=993502 RepID=A0A562KRP5_9BRAD|nr:MULTISPECIES: catalase family peroxidase [Bradyrhizobium]MDQ8731711.1 catalase family peroxidase [Bradyrhizobium sp. LHD-71]TWH97935.1 catalase [Bradyrhizobium daqingense]UFS91564.1 catalase family peroxidase [Bradyrhizobium daqingense]